VLLELREEQVQESQKGKHFSTAGTNTNSGAFRAASSAANRGAHACTLNFGTFGTKQPVILPHLGSWGRRLRSAPPIFSCCQVAPCHRAARGAVVVVLPVHSPRGVRGKGRQGWPIPA
jgi:hypothetical protein